MSSTTQIAEVNQNLLSPDMDEWEEFLEGRYKEGKSQEEFRQYDAEANPGVAEFYRLNHTYQTQPDARLRPGQGKSVLRAQARRQEHLGSSRISEHSRRRQRP